MTDITHPRIEDYAARHSSPEPPLLIELAEATRGFSDDHGMMVGRLEGRLLKLLVAISRARRVLEIGTFTGYSALSMAEALPPDGRIVTCELSERHADVAQSFIDRSPHGAQIEIRRGPAGATLAALEGDFDFVFIDADKTGYLAYYEAVLPKLRSGGLIAADNVLWSGRVLDEASDDADTRALREFNAFVATDARVECVMLPVRDGLTLARKL
ncbi:MAG TPA: class I SAM-dependent methyltransferase [Candidatus Limnocylindria bacterium]|nr:class I SAM-dependent methyltransferase [Candidatus Limnocylindria bacterium]